MVAEIVGNDGASKASAQGENRAVLVWKGAYEPGDRIRFQAEETGCFYVIQADDVLGESLVYLTAKELEFEIPFEEKKTSYNPKAFAGDIHYLYIRKARPEEWEGCRNLALNPMDQHGDRGCFPHAWANVETRGEAVFAARNAIDGVTANASHGAWPYESWGINRRDDAEFTLEFGRPWILTRLCFIPGRTSPMTTGGFGRTLNSLTAPWSRFPWKRAASPIPSP